MARPLYPRGRAEALALLQAARGHADIGVAQIHYPIWGPVFGLQPEDLLDPWINLHAAAGILRLAMAREPDSWGGVGRYHSGTPRRKWAYASRVAAAVHALRARARLSGSGSRRDRVVARRAASWDRLCRWGAPRGSDRGP